MRNYKFDSEETKEYFDKALRKYHTGNPNWDPDTVITKEDVDTYIKDAENILQC